MTRPPPFPGDYKRAARIVARRTALGLSIAQLSERSGLDAGTLYELEQAAPIAINEIGMLARALDVDLVWLLNGDEPRDTTH